MAGRYVTIELDRPRRLLYDLNALAEIEERLNIGVDQIGNLPAKAKVIRVLLWAGLIHEDPGLTVEQAGAMVTGDRFVYVTEKIGEALQKAFGSGTEGNAKGPEAGTGKKPSE